MTQQRDSQRSEPSFGTEDEQRSGNGVDFDELFAEIDRSVSAASLNAPPPAAEESMPTAEAPDEFEVVAPAASTVGQSNLDFGAVEEDIFTPHSGQQPTQPQSVRSSGDKAMSRGVLMAGGALVALGILLGAAGMYVGLNAASQVAVLQQSVDALQTKLATTQVSGDPRVGQMQAEQAGLVSRLDEMSARLDAQSAQKGEEPRLAEMAKRIEQLEQRSAAAKSAPPPSTKSTAAAAPKPAAAKPAAPKPAVAGGWTVILSSHGSEGQAESERARVQRLGYPSEVLKSSVDDTTRYRVRILGYASRDAAKAAIPAIEAKTGIKGAWAAQR